MREPYDQIMDDRAEKEAEAKRLLPEGKLFWELIHQYRKLRCCLSLNSAHSYLRLYKEGALWGCKHNREVN